MVHYIFGLKFALFLSQKNDSYRLKDKDCGKAALGDRAKFFIDLVPTQSKIFILQSTVIFLINITINNDY